MVLNLPSHRLEHTIPEETLIRRSACRLPLPEHIAPHTAEAKSLLASTNSRPPICLEQTVSTFDFFDIISAAH